MIYVFVVEFKKIVTSVSRKLFFYFISFLFYLISFCLKVSLWASINLNRNLTKKKGNDEKAREKSLILENLTFLKVNQTEFNQHPTFHNLDQN